MPNWLRRGVCTYELFPSGRKSVQVRIYADDANLLIGRASHCKPQEKPSNIGKEVPGVPGVENLLDAVVTAVLRKIEPRFAKSVLGDIEVEKRTVLDTGGHFILFLTYS